MLFSFVRYRLQYARQFAQLVGVQPDAADRVPVMGGQHPCAGAVTAPVGQPRECHVAVAGTHDHAAPAFDFDSVRHSFSLAGMVRPSRIRYAVESMGCRGLRRHCSFSSPNSSLCRLYNVWRVMPSADVISVLLRWAFRTASRTANDSNASSPARSRDVHSNAAVNNYIENNSHCQMFYEQFLNLFNFIF